MVLVVCQFSVAHISRKSRWYFGYCVCVCVVCLMSILTDNWWAHTIAGLSIVSVLSTYIFHDTIHFCILPIIGTIIDLAPPADGAESPKHRQRTMTRSVDAGWFLLVVSWCSLVGGWWWRTVDTTGELGIPVEQDNCCLLERNRASYCKMERTTDTHTHTHTSTRTIEACDYWSWSSVTLAGNHSQQQNSSVVHFQHNHCAHLQQVRGRERMPFRENCLLLTKNCLLRTMETLIIIIIIMADWLS